MSTFRFAIMGAGNIAHQFCDAVTLVEDCEVSAIASKDLGRAQKFAEECSVAHAYDNYEQMLIEEKPDCVYIAVTPNDHFRLTMLCLEHRVPVLCEKAMFTNSAEAKAVFEKAEKDQTFVMEAMWSRFLPAVNQAKKWAAEGKIGRLEALQGRIGFTALCCAAELRRISRFMPMKSRPGWSMSLSAKPMRLRTLIRPVWT